MQRLLPILLVITYVCGGVVCLEQFEWAEICCPQPGAFILTRGAEPDDTWGRPDRARYTLPPEVTLADSPIPNANLGIFATTLIPRFTWLGEYQGDVVKEFADISDYAWEVYRGGKLSHYVDAGDPETSNWLRWINCPRNVLEENVWMTACKGRIYYITSKDVQPGDELLVYYGDNYFKHLGFDPAVFYNRDVTIGRCGGRHVCCKEQVIVPE